MHQFAAAYEAPLALRFDVNPPSVQQVRHRAVTPRGQQHVAFDLLSLPLYQVEYAAGTTREFVTTG